MFTRLVLLLLVALGGAGLTLQMGLECAFANVNRLSGSHHDYLSVG